MKVVDRYAILRGELTGRSLNSQEIEIAKRVFGDQIDYSIVRIVENSFEMKAGDGMVAGNTVFLKGSSLGSDIDMTTYLHEMTHIFKTNIRW